MNSFSKNFDYINNRQFNDLEHQDQLSDQSGLFLFDREPEESSRTSKRPRLSASRDSGANFCLPSAASLFASEHLCESGDNLADNSFFTDLLVETDPNTDHFDSPNLSDYLPNLTLPSEHTSSTLLYSHLEPSQSQSDPANLFNRDTYPKTEGREFHPLCKEETTEVVEEIKDTSESGASEVVSKKSNRKTITPHRLIEKRRRDRINQSLQELKSLVLPPAKAKSKLDKADILRLAIDHIKMLHEQNKENNTDNQLKRKMLKEENLDPNKDESQSVHETKSSTQAYVGQHIMLGYMDCHQEAIDFLIQQANIPEDHPLIKQLNCHLLKQQQNLDLSAMERNLQLAQELRNVAELNSSLLNPSEESATKTYTNSDIGDEGASSLSSSAMTSLVESASSEVTSLIASSVTDVTSLKVMSSTPKRAKRDAQSLVTIPNIPDISSYQSGQPIAETYLSSCHLNSGISSASVQTSSSVIKLTKEKKIPDSLPSFPIFAMPYISSPKQQIVEQAKPSIYSINCK